MRGIFIIAVLAFSCFAPLTRADFSLSSGIIDAGWTGSPNETDDHAVAVSGVNSWLASYGDSDGQSWGVLNASGTTSSVIVGAGHANAEINTFGADFSASGNIHGTGAGKCSVIGVVKGAGDIQTSSASLILPVGESQRFGVLVSLGQSAASFGVSISAHALDTEFDGNILESSATMYYVFYPSGMGTPTQLDAGDLDVSGDHSRMDVALMWAALLGNTGGFSASHFDLNADSAVDLDDMQALLWTYFDTVPGDADLDGDVDDDDIAILEANFGNAGLFMDGDFNCDGIVDSDDDAILEDNYGFGI